MFLQQPQARAHHFTLVREPTGLDQAVDERALVFRDGVHSTRLVGQERRERLAKLLRHIPDLFL